MILQVLQFPDPELRVKATPFLEGEVTDEVRDLARNMAETMYEEFGLM